PLQLGVPLAAPLPPFHAGRQLRLHRLLRGGRVEAHGALVAALPERPAGGLGGLGGFEEQVEEVLQGGYLVPGRHLDDVRTGALVLPGAGPEADDDQSPDQVGMAQRQRLRNAAAERKAEDVDRARPSALTKVAAWSASASMVSGVSPLEL